MTIRVFLDASVLPRSVSAPPGEFLALGQLAHEGIVTVYLSTVAYQEWVTQRRDEYLGKVRPSIKEMRRLLRDPRSEQLAVRDELESIIASLEESLGEVESMATSDAEAALDKLTPQVLPTLDRHTKSVFEAYFLGRPPFSSVKSRRDMPDAFIFEALRDLARSDKDCVHAVINDKSLREAAQKLQNVQTYESLEELTSSPVLADASARLRKAEAWKTWIDLNCSELMSYSQALEAHIRETAVDFLSNRTVRHREIPEDNHEGVISMVDDPSGIQVDWENMKSYGVGILSIPVLFEVDVLIDFHVFRMDAYTVPERVSVVFGDPERDYFFDADANVGVQVSAEMILHISDEDVEAGRIGNLKEIGLAEECEVDVVEDEIDGIFQHLQS